MKLFERRTRALARAVSPKQPRARDLLATKVILLRIMDYIPFQFTLNPFPMFPRLLEYEIVSNFMPEAASETAASPVLGEGAHSNLVRTPILDRLSRQRRPPRTFLMHQSIQVMYLVHIVHFFLHSCPPTRCGRRRLLAAVRPRPTTENEHPQRPKSAVKRLNSVHGTYSDAWAAIHAWEGGRSWAGTKVRPPCSYFIHRTPYLFDCLRAARRRLNRLLCIYIRIVRPC